MTGRQPVMARSSYWACVDGYAVPGAGTLIDGINPATGLTWVYKKSHAEVLAEDPGAIRVSLEDWCQEKATRQRTPIRWDLSTREQFDAMLGCLPPIDWTPHGFLVGEPSDHDAGDGRPRFQAYRTRVVAGAAQYYCSSRPMTRQEFVHADV